LEAVVAHHSLCFRWLNRKITKKKHQKTITLFCRYGNSRLLVEIAATLSVPVQFGTKLRRFNKVEEDLAEACDSPSLTRTSFKSRVAWCAQGHG
jgi:hypothetical protein